MQIPEILKDKRVIIGAGVAAAIVLVVAVYRTTRKKKPELTLHKNPTPAPQQKPLTTSVTTSAPATVGSTEVPFPSKAFGGPEANA